MEPLTAGDSADQTKPFTMLADWLREAGDSEINDPNAMSLATVDADGLPDVRMVLMKGFDASGIVFYTNRQSAKGVELEATGKAAANFHWKSLRRQVRLRGLVTPVSDAESDAYFASRPRDSRIGAWASQQSRPMEGRFALEKAVAVYAARYAVGEVPRPAYWIGYRIAPLSFEFWRDKPFRLHERVVFRRETIATSWRVERALSLKTPPRSHTENRYISAMPESAPSERHFPTRPILAASVAVFRDGKVLLGSRGIPPFEGVFTLPGGLVELGETLETAALRECLEETGVAAEILGFTGHAEVIRHEEGRVRTHFVICSFAGRWISGEAMPGDELREVRWVTLDEAAALTLTPGLLPILRRGAAMRDRA